MSDIPTTNTLPEDALRMMRTAFRMDPRSARCLEDAEAEITRLLAELAEAQEERDNLAKEVSHLRTAMSREGGPQYLASLLMEAENALLSVAQQRTQAERDLAAAQEREQRMRGALALIAVVDQGCGGNLSFKEMAESAMRQARAALSAMRGEP